ncbi:hypothetical protein GCM10027037_29730 [Mucilaginibacter koreensis]
MKKIFYIAAMAAITVTSGCKKYLDVNQNPSTPQVADAAALLPSMQANMARGLWFDGRYAGQYVQQWGSSTAANTWDRQGYASGSDAFGEMWRQHYYAIGTNVDLMWQDAQKNQKWDYMGVGYAIRAWSWQVSTDQYNEMILKQAWDPTRTVFDYDSQPEIYAEVRRLCNEALNYLNRTDGAVSTASLGRGDYMYYGDRTKWIKFVNALMAMNYHHRTNKSNYNADSVIYYVDHSFQSNADNATVQCNGSSTGDGNFWGPARQNLNSFRQSDYMVRLLDGRIFTGAATQDTTVDPRLRLMLTASKDGIYRGVLTAAGDPNRLNTSASIPYLWGYPSAVASGSSVIVNTPPTAGYPAKYIFRDNSRAVIITYAQLQFMKAEALFRKGDKSGALAAYKLGIAAHLDFVSNPPVGNSIAGSANNISSTAQAAYLAGKCVKQSPAALQLSDILQQKYIAEFGYGQLETWVDMRRFHYDTNVYQGFSPPVAPQTLFPDNNGKLAYRARPRYNSEYVWNIDALRKIGALQTDYHTVEPWFSQNQ